MIVWRIYSSFPQSIEEKYLVSCSYSAAAVAFLKLFTSSDLKKAIFCFLFVEPVRG